MRMFFRTRAEKRRGNRRVARWFFASMLVLTLFYGAVLLLASLFGRP